MAATGTAVGLGAACNSLAEAKAPLALMVPTVPAGLSSVMPHSCRTSTPCPSKNSIMRLQARGKAASTDRRRRKVPSMLGP